MKPTLILLAIAIVLTGGIYLFEERANIADHEKTEKETTLFNPHELGDMMGFKGNQFEVKLEGRQFYTVNPRRKVDTRNVDAFFNELSGLRVKRILNKEELSKISLDNLFDPKKSDSLEFQFTNKKIIFKLGKKLDFDESFYMEVDEGEKKNIIIAKDINTVDEVYLQADAHKSDLKYRRFKALIEMEQTYFYDMRLFKREDYPEFENISSMEVKSSRNRSYSLDLQKNTTNPAPPPGVSIDIDLLNQHFQEIIGLTGEMLVEREENEKYFKSEVLIKSGDRNFSIKLYHDPNKNEYFAKASDEKSSYLLIGKNALPLLRPVQDFWNMTLPFVGDLETRIIFPKVEVSFILPSVFEKHCQLTSKKGSRSIRQLACTELNQFIRSRAYDVQYASDLTKKIAWSFELEIKGRIYAVGSLNGVGYIWDRAADLLYNYSREFSLRPKDFLI